MNQKCKFLIRILWNLDIFYIFIINLAKISKKDYIFDYAKLYGLKNEKNVKFSINRNIILVLTWKNFIFLKI